MTTALSHPERSVLICVLMAVGGALAVWWGAAEMTAMGRETLATAACIALGGLSAIFGTVFFFNFVWAARLVADMRAGRGVIARWTLAPDSFERFRRVDRDLNRTEGLGDYTPPRTIPANGVEVIFSADAVMIGEVFVGLANTGLARFDQVALRAFDPPVLQFGTVFTRPVGAPPVGLRHIRGVLRVPVAPHASAEADVVIRHYQDVVARRTIVKPDFWRLRIRIGLAVAIVCFAAAGVGWALFERDSELGGVPSMLLGGGIVLGGAGLIGAGAAWGFHRSQRRRPGS